MKVDGGIQDYWDCSLKYLKALGWGDTFNNEGNNVKDFNCYINYFYLWDYIGKDGNVITLDKNDFNNYINTVNGLIKRRGRFMVAMLEVYLKLNKSQADNIRSVFLKNDAIYSSYEDVADEIKKQIVDDKTFDEKSKEETISVLNKALKEI